MPRHPRPRLPRHPPVRSRGGPPRAHPQEVVDRPGGLGHRQADPQRVRQLPSDLRTVGVVHPVRSPSGDRVLRVTPFVRPSAAGAARAHDHEHRRRGRDPAPASAAHAVPAHSAAPSGSSNETSSPPSSGVSTLSSPPIVSRRSVAIARPSPEPGTPPLSSLRQNRSAAFSACSGQPWAVIADGQHAEPVPAVRSDLDDGIGGREFHRVVDDRVERALDDRAIGDAHHRVGPDESVRIPR